MKTKFFVLALLVVAGALIAIILNRRPASQAIPEVASQPPQPVLRTTTPPAVSLLEEKTEPQPKHRKPVGSEVPSNLVLTNTTVPESTTNALPVAVQAPQVQQPKGKLHDPLARMALAYVGEDPDAEAYWTGAIFDKNLPDGERDDLMEDLNEVGFADPDHPSLQDLPLIENRIAIIEDVAPYATPFMLRHLGEAWKDLDNMEYQVVSGR